MFVVIPHLAFIAFVCVFVCVFVFSFFHFDFYFCFVFSLHAPSLGLSFHLVLKSCLIISLSLSICVCIFIHMYVCMYREEGILSLYSGLIPRVLRMGSFSLSLSLVSSYFALSFVSLSCLVFVFVLRFSCLYLHFCLHFFLKPYIYVYVHMLYLCHSPSKGYHFRGVGENHAALR